MTREEAIRCLSVHSSTNGSGLCTDEQHYKAKQMAIQALSQEPCFSQEKSRFSQEVSQEPCDDTISREDRLIDLANAIESDDSGYWTNKRISSALRNIEKLPSVTQKSGNWIDVNERLPEEYGEYLVTWKTNDSSTPFISVCEYETSYEYDVEKHRFKGEWLVDDYILVHSDYEVIAWMPLPEPYEPQESEE